MKSIKTLFAVAAVLAVCPAMAQKSIPLVYDQEFKGAKYAAPAFPSVSDAKTLETLPNPFEFSNGKKKVKKFKDWEKRRAEIVRELQHYEIGEKPMVDRKDVEATMEGNKLTVKVTRNGETLEITANITYPEGDGPFPLMIGASNNALPRQFFTDRKIATVNFSERQVNSYSQMGGFGGGGGQRPGRGSYPFDKLYPELVDNGAYSEWAWGVSRLIDGLEIVGAASKIDLKHIGITGCSYAGKMALWSGAMDERIALTIAQEPGGGGAAAWRYSRWINKQPGAEAVEGLDNTDYHWFKESLRENYHGDSVAYLPHDHHELAAMVCPRALLMLGNPDFVWLADPSAYVSMNGAIKVWEQFGIADRVGYSIVPGHGHCQLHKAQYPEVEAYIDKFLLGKEANTMVRIAPDSYANIDLKRWIPWN